MGGKAQIRKIRNHTVRELVPRPGDFVIAPMNLGAPGLVRHGGRPGKPQIYAVVVLAHCSARATRRPRRGWGSGTGEAVQLQKCPQIENARDRSLWRFLLGALAAHRIIDRPIQPCDRDSSFPVSARLPVPPPWQLRVAPWLHPSARPAAHSPSCLGAYAHRLCRRWIARVAPRPPSFGAAGDRFHGSPRFLAPPASPPALPPGCPGFRAFRLCQRWSLGLPRVSMPSALPAADSTGRPASSLLQPRLRCFHRVAPASTSLAVPRVNLRVTPNLPAPWRCRFCVSGLPRVLHVRLGR